MIDPKETKVGDRVDTVCGLGVVTEVHTHGLRVALDKGGWAICQLYHARKYNDGDARKPFDGIRTIRIERDGDGLGSSMRITSSTPTGHLEHEPTKAQIPAGSKIGWFKRLMQKWCFGLKYVKRNK